MWQTAAVVVLLALGSAAINPPTISDSFSAVVQATEFPGISTDTVMLWSDASTQSLLSETNETVDGQLVPTFDLHLYPTKENFVYTTAVSPPQCSSKHVNGSFPSFFQWVNNGLTKFEGQTILNGQLVDLWVLNVNNGDLVLSLWVMPGTSTPAQLSVWIEGRVHNRTLVLAFSEWQPNTPPPAVFAVPQFCPIPPETNTDREDDARDDGPSNSALSQSLAMRSIGRAIDAISATVIGTEGPGVDWQCDACEVAVEAVIFAGCTGGSAACGPFEPACDILCEGGCMAAGCSEWACTQAGFCSSV